MSIWPYIRHGDVEGACIDILNNASEIQALSPVPVVSSNMLGYSRGQHRIEVVREGGAVPWPKKAEKPRIDFMCYASSRIAANDIAQVAHAVMCRAMGDYVGFGIRLLDVKTETGIYRLPDKETDSPRYFFSLRLVCTPE